GLGGGLGGAGAGGAAEADIIAPAPLHWRRLVRRRYNQAGELAREIARAAAREGALVLDLLERTRATPSQDGKNRAQRHENVSGVFTVSARRRGGVAGKRVLLIDDVLTTGATLSGCAEACRAAGAADVNVLVFARVARGDWPA
ncbi:MAG: phosphoribosyltransferase family protein, partial [Paracoccaceae bacterium]